MRKFSIKESSQKGSLMVEALALLGLITMVTPVLYKKAAERTTELHDINIATQMRMLSSAVDDYIKDNYNELSANTGLGEVFSLTAAQRGELAQYLPHGFSLDASKLFDAYDIGIRRRVVTDSNGRDHNIYTSAIMAPLKENMTMMRSSRIASMIGANGGVYRDGQLQGAQGSWSAGLSDYGFSAPSVGSLVAISTDAITAAKGDVSSDQVLYRIDDGDAAKNTMQTELNMGGNDVEGVVSLIAEGSNVYIGKSDGSLASNLVVQGASNLKNALTVEAGGASIHDGLGVSGVTDLDGTLSVSGGTSLGGTLGVAGATTLNSSLTVQGATTLNNTTTITGALTQKGGDVALKGNSKAEIKVNSYGLRVTSDKKSYSTSLVGVSGGTMDYYNYIYGGTRVQGSLYAEEVVTGNIRANWLYADTGLKVGPNKSGSYFSVSSDGTKVGSGTFNVRDNLKADNQEVAITQNKFSVGDRIKTDNSSAYIGMDANQGLTINNNKALLQSSDGFLQIDGDGTWLNYDYASLKLRNHYFLLDADAEDGSISSIDNQGGIISLKSWGPDAGQSDLKVHPEKVAMKDSGFIMDDYGMAVAKKGQKLNNESIILDGENPDPSSILDSTAAVAISREGIIEVRSPTSTTDKGGFIRARRMVSDVEYPGGNYTGFTASGGEPTKQYEYYEVNPAYTSVMNDIKLASRGGARLSDILPDYINKGIYVVDNSYKNSNTDWDTYVSASGVVSEPATCSDNSCIASPWLGFVPAPQCPRGYAQVITVNPIRWRMAEVYSTYGADVWPAANTADYTKVIQGDSFDTYFIRPRDPRTSDFKLSNSGGDDHTHTVVGGNPLTFQINTWLNTTIAGKEDASGDYLLGWHAIMGFLYRPSHYATLLGEMGLTTGANDIYWNIFPVYAYDMAAIANVYCYFEREDGAGWFWGNEVYKYNQLGTYRKGWNKDSTWASQVNDPTLGYDDAW